MRELFRGILPGPLPGPERCSWHFSPRPGKPIGARGARHSCRFSVNHSLVSAGGQTFWTVKRAEPRLGNKRRAPVSCSHQFNCIVGQASRLSPSVLDSIPNWYEAASPSQPLQREFSLNGDRRDACPTASFRPGRAGTFYCSGQHDPMPFCGILWACFCN